MPLSGGRLAAHTGRVHTNRPDRGHAARAHTADALIEAWAPTAAGCYEEAADAFVELFAETTDQSRTVVAGAAEPFAVGPGRAEELLVLLLEEILYRAEAGGRVPVATDVEVQGNRLVGRFTTVPVAAVQIVGAIPKGVSYSDLAFEPAATGWQCRATIDV